MNSRRVTKMHAAWMAPAQATMGGAALIILLTILGLGAAFFVVSRLGGAAARNAQNAVTQSALSQARDALISDAVSSQDIAIGNLPLPDLGPGTSLGREGSSAGSIGTTDATMIGKLPWYSLGLPPLRDGDNECLWYVVSGRFKHNPATAALNWDTQGQIDVIDGQGNTVATNIVALVVSAGGIRDGQSRNLVDPEYATCGGNYDARNYLDAYSVANAIGGEVNYFGGATNGRQASGSANKRFVLAANEHYNDKFLFITVDDIFRLIIKRKDFAARIDALLTNLIPVVQTMPTSSITGPKGTDNLSCNALSDPDKTFCMNWKEMLFLTELPTPSVSCTRVLIFAGQKATGQNRLSAADKLNKANYLEGANSAAFDTPIASSNAITGSAYFDPTVPEADIVKCVP